MWGLLLLLLLRSSSSEFMERGIFLLCLELCDQFSLCGNLTDDDDDDDKTHETVSRTLRAHKYL